MVVVLCRLLKPDCFSVFDYCNVQLESREVEDNQIRREEKEGVLFIFDSLRAAEEQKLSLALSLFQ